MKVTLYDPPGPRLDLLPFTYTRPISEIRTGLLTIREKWQKYLNAEIAYHTEEYLGSQFRSSPGHDLVIESNVLPDDSLAKSISTLKPGQALVDEAGSIIAFFRDKDFDIATVSEQDWDNVTYNNPTTRIDHLWDIFRNNEAEIKKDFVLITKGRESAGISDPHSKVYNEEQIFVEDGVNVKAAILNAEDGPIYLGEGSVVQEGAIIQGPFGLGAHSVINMGAKIRKNNSTGPYTKLGGEVSNSVFFGFSNKAHDGFVGNSVIGEWCNIGADTNTSNLKNNYSEVKVWNYRKNTFINTGSQFCGLMMADHSKCAINTMFNTGSVVGVGANIFGAGFPRTSVPSFSWGGATGFKTFDFDKAIEASEAMMERRNRSFTSEEKAILKHVFDISSQYRIWENAKK